MDNLVSEDLFTIPLVLQQHPVGQSVNLVGCNDWLNKDSVQHAVPFVILDNTELSFQNDAVDFLTATNTSEPSQLEIRRNKTELTPTGNDERDEAVAIEDLIETVVLYKCKLCAFKSPEKSAVLKHLKDAHFKLKDEKPPDSEHAEPAQEVYICGNCSEAFTSYNECRVHVAQRHEIPEAEAKSLAKRLQSPTKEMKDVEQIDLTSKEETDKEQSKKPMCSPCAFAKKTLLCPVKGCLLKFANATNVNKHKVCHSPENVKDFICNYCSTKFNKWTQCANHLWRAHTVDIDLYSCSVCNYKTVRKEKMKTHESTHSDHKDFKCCYCGKLFSQKAQLCNHEVSHFKPSTNGNRWYMKKECDQCLRIFADAKSLKKHVQAVHSKLKPYVCQVCGHCSATKALLQTHFRQHTGEKPFKCNVCPYMTGDHNSLRRHRMRHTGDKPYKCPHCPYSTIQSPSLKHHVLTWHPTKVSSAIFCCNHCSYRSVSEKCFQQHMAAEHKGVSDEVLVSNTSNSPECKLEEVAAANVDGAITNFDSAQFTVVGEGTKIHLGGIRIPAEENKEIVIELDDTYLKTQHFISSTSGNICL